MSKEPLKTDFLIENNNDEEVDDDDETSSLGATVYRQQGTRA